MKRTSPLLASGLGICLVGLAFIIGGGNDGSMSTVGYIITCVGVAAVVASLIVTAVKRGRKATDHQ